MSAELAVIRRAETDGGGVARRKTNHREPRHERPRMPAGAFMTSRTKAVTVRSSVSVAAPVGPMMSAVKMKADEWAMEASSSFDVI
jgi:hypothetical protein